MKYLGSDSFNSLLRPFSSLFDNGNTSGIMTTDVKSNDEEYNLSIDLPGIKKEDINISLQDGYLTIEATRNNETTEKDDKSNYVFREKVYGRMSRSFYVGDEIHEDSVKAKYDNGVLNVIVPKIKEEEKEIKTISID